MAKESIKKASSEIDMPESITVDQIQNKIYSVRGLQVMLDKDLAAYYGVKPIRLREQIRRNITRFPPDFMFQLTDEEIETMVSQNAIPSRQHLGGARPYMFTEQGVAATSSVLTSERAVEVSIQIMRAFVAMRRFLLTNAQVFQRLDILEHKQLITDEKINTVFSAIENKVILPKQGIFFEGQIFDAYQFVSDLVRSAEKSIILVDNYVDDTILTLFTKRKKNVSLLILTKTISQQMQLDVAKYNCQYPPVKILEFKKSHDRFLILDDTEVYHFGASLKDLGKKWFAFSKIDKDSITIIKRISELNNTL
ncbi:MAG: ORF6N domain-containing protein [Methanomicrobium sp.]|nr:ORF6N domain-containing protein [Methanomicrobium sp.]